MKRLLPAALLLLAACAAAPVDAAKPPVDARRSVLVVDFTDTTGQGNAALAAAAADHVVAALTASGRFRVVDRSQTSSDAVKLKGVDFVVVGSVTSLGARVESEQTAEGRVKTQISECRMSVKVLSTEAGSVVAALEGRGIAKRSAKEPARMSFDPTLAAESVKKGVEDVTGPLLDSLK